MQPVLSLGQRLDSRRQLCRCRFGCDDRVQVDRRVAGLGDERLDGIRKRLRIGGGLCRDNRIVGGIGEHRHQRRDRKLPRPRFIESVQAQNGGFIQSRRLCPELQKGGRDRPFVRRVHMERPRRDCQVFGIRRFQDDQSAGCQDPLDLI